MIEKIENLKPDNICQQNFQPVTNEFIILYGGIVSTKNLNIFNFAF